MQFGGCAENESRTSSEILQEKLQKPCLSYLTFKAIML